MPFLPVRARVNALLVACGYPPLPPAARPRRAGAGAWHDAYRVRFADGRRTIVRLRKATIYGRAEQYDERALHSDYAGVGAYYAAANGALPGLCPVEYRYHAGPTLSGTVESDLGPALRLDTLTPASARALGEQIGAAFRVLHARPPDCPGWGELVWTAGGVRGEDGRPAAAIGLALAARRRAGLAHLATVDAALGRPVVRLGLEATIARRTTPDEPPALVNGDITPENLIARRGRFLGLVDPVPGIGHGARYAAFFLFCYRCLLPALHDAPRYARHRFDRHAPLLARIADGYEDAYLRPLPVSQGRAVRDEYSLWLLDEAISCQGRLGQPLTAEGVLRTGGPAAIGRRLGEYCRLLASRFG